MSEYNAEYQKEWREKNKNYFKEWVEKNPEYYKKLYYKRIDKQREAYRKWYKKNGRVRSSEYADVIQDWIKKHPLENAARIKVNNELKSGRLKKKTKCENCGRETKLSGHHKDYAKPLEVVWLCASCHKRVHNGKIKV